MDGKPREVSVLPRLSHPSQCGQHLSCLHLRKVKMKKFKERVQGHTCKSNRGECMKFYLSTRSMPFPLCFFVYIRLLLLLRKRYNLGVIINLYEPCGAVGYIADYGKEKKIILFQRYCSSSKAKLTDLYRGM